MQSWDKQPGPIVIEKFSPCVTPPPKKLAHSQQLSLVNADQLNAAIELAKRDIKRSEEIKIASPKSKENNRKKAKIVKSNDYKERLRRRQERTESENKILLVERIKSRPCHAQGDQFRPSEAYKSVNKKSVNQKSSNSNDLSTLPVRSMSPPVRDTDSAVPSGERRLLYEMEKLQEHMIRTFRQLQRKIAENKKKTVVPVDILEEELDRLAIRGAEWERQTARTLYVLTQQLKDVESEITLNEQQSVDMRLIKRPQLLSRLVTISRSVMKVLESMDSQADKLLVVTKTSRCYQDVTFLSRRLALCCARLEGATAPGSVHGLLTATEEINSLLIPPVEQQQPLTTSNSQKSVISKEKLPASSRPDQPIIASRQDDETQQFSEISTVYQEPIRHSAITQKLRKDIQQPKNTIRAQQTYSVQFRDKLSQPAASSSERQRALKAGIHALLQSAQHFDEDLRPNSRTEMVDQRNAELITSHQVYNRTNSNSRHEREQNYVKKNKLKLRKPIRKREKDASKERQRSCGCDDSASHYSRPTFASIQKEVPKPRSRSSSPRYEKGSMKHLPADVAEQITEDLRRAKMMRSRQLLKPMQAPGIDNIVDNLVAVAEEKIYRRIEPHLRRFGPDRPADHRNFKEQDDGMNAPFGLTHKLSQHMVECVQKNSEEISDIILDELLDDTAQELLMKRLDTESAVAAHRLQHAPGVRDILFRLQEMEAEQAEIARRWPTIVYNDEQLPQSSHLNSKKFSEDFNDNDSLFSPRTPPPLIVSSKIQAHAAKSNVTFADNMQQSNYDYNNIGDSIVFTKTNSYASNEKKHSYSIPSNEKLIRESRLKLNLSQEMIANIDKNKCAYESYLKKTTTLALGRFDPWKLVTEIADEIFDDCVRSVGQELDSINADIVNHVYSTEFTCDPVDNAKLKELLVLDGNKPEKERFTNDSKLQLPAALVHIAASRPTFDASTNPDDSKSSDKSKRNEIRKDELIHSDDLKNDELLLPKESPIEKENVMKPHHNETDPRVRQEHVKEKKSADDQRPVFVEGASTNGEEDESEKEVKSGGKKEEYEDDFEPDEDVREDADVTINSTSDDGDLDLVTDDDDNSDAE